MTNGYRKPLPSRRRGAQSVEVNYDLLTMNLASVVDISAPTPAGRPDFIKDFFDLIACHPSTLPSTPHRIAHTRAVSIHCRRGRHQVTEWAKKCSHGPCIVYKECDKTACEYRA